MLLVVLALVSAQGEGREEALVRLWDTGKVYARKNPMSAAWKDRANWVQVPHGKSRICAFVEEDGEDFILDAKRRRFTKEVNIPAPEGAIGIINFSRRFRTDHDFMWFMAFPPGAEKHKLTYLGFHADPFWEDARRDRPSVGAQYASLDKGLVVIGVLNAKDNWQREDVGRRLAAGETYRTKFRAPYPGQWKLVARLDGRHVHRRVEIRKPGEQLAFQSEIGGLLDYVMVYLWDRTAATPASLFTPMDVYRDAILAREADWPQWRGQNRDGVSTETGLLEQWPDGGPKLLWTAKGCGAGYSTVAIADGLIHTTGDFGKQCFVLAFDLNGDLKWKTANGRAWTGETPGARGIPTVDGDRLFSMNAHGELICLEARTGKRVWSRNVVKDFSGKVIRWGLAESVLVDGNNVICTPGGRDACLVALDKRTGRTVWTSRGVSDEPGYASPIVFEFGGVRQVVNLTSKGLVAVRAETGQLLWRYAPRAGDLCVPTPIYSNGSVFTSCYHFPGGEVKLSTTDNKVTAAEAWRTDHMQNYHGGVVLVNGYLYGNHKTGWSCIDFQSGRLMWSAKGIGMGSLTYADGMLYCLNERGTMALVKATPKAYALVSQFRIPRGGRGPTWAHPVVCGRRLYTRHGDCLYAFDVKREVRP